MKVEGSAYNLYMCDVGGEIDFSKLERVLNKTPEFVELKYGQLMPRYVKIEPMPLQVELKKKTISGIQHEIFIRIYALGAITVCIKRDFDCEFEELLKPVDEAKYRKEAEEIIEKALKELSGCFVKKYSREKEPEDYRIFAIKKTEKPIKGEEFLKENKKEIAALLREEEKTDVLGGEELEKAVRHPLSYYKNDLVVIGYANALMLSPGNESDLRLVIELANIQLLELRAYSGLLDKCLDEAYNDLRITTHASILKSARFTKTFEKICEMRMDISDLVGNALNISKLAGDWYTVRVYNTAAERLHLQQRKEEVYQKLDLLEDFYSMAVQRTEAHRANFLELLIVFLIIFEIVLSLTTLK